MANSDLCGGSTKVMIIAVMTFRLHAPWVHRADNNKKEGLRPLIFGIIAVIQKLIQREKI